MKILLTAINAKYIHSNLAVYSLQAYAAAHGHKIERAEYTINNQLEDILEKIYCQKPDILLFSCYIWNVEYVKELVSEFHKLRPEVPIWVGGPEVSFETERFLKENPAITGIMMGEGERTLTELCEYFEQCEQDAQSLSQNRDEARNETAGAGMEYEKKSGAFTVLNEEMLKKIDGISYRRSDGTVAIQPLRSLLPMDELPFCYANLKDFEHRIIYYESSRGCPFNCSYCLSSIDKTVRFRSLDLVMKELDYFLERKVPQVKFVDRTFNCKKSHALAIWRYLLEHDNGVTNFHFEISADLIDEEELEVMEQMRPGLIQLEIGVQTTNPDTITEIRRKMNLDRLKQVVDKINGFHNIHQHLDLIVGLPYENYERFCQSFDDVYWMRPEQLQLGFLKVLTGSYMAEKTQDYGLLYHQEPPYEVLATKWLDYGQVLRLKAVEDMVEVHYNSGQYTETLREMEQHWASPYAMFEALADYYERLGYTGIAINRLTRYEILFGFLQETEPEKTERYRDLLTYDLYLRENIKSRPAFLRDESPWKTLRREFFQGEEKEPKYLKGYEGYDSRQMAKMAHLEVFGDGRVVVFDYKNRDPLTYNAKAFLIAANPA